MSKYFIGIILKSAVAFGLLLGTSESARADGSCTALVSSMANQLNQHGGVYDFEMTMHRTDVALVVYNKGTLHGTGSAAWPATGTAKQLFNDRKAGTQPFNINAADTMTPWISSTGELYIYSNTWNYSTTWDMTCTGSTFTRYIPDFGVVSLTLRGWHP